MNIKTATDKYLAKLPENEDEYKKSLNLQIHKIQNEFTSREIDIQIIKYDKNAIPKSILTFIFGKYKFLLAGKKYIEENNINCAYSLKKNKKIIATALLYEDKESVLIQNIKYSDFELSIILGIDIIKDAIFNKKKYVFFSDKIDTNYKKILSCKNH